MRSSDTEALQIIRVEIRIKGDRGLIPAGIHISGRRVISAEIIKEDHHIIDLSCIHRYRHTVVSRGESRIKEGHRLISVPNQTKPHHPEINAESMVRPPIRTKGVNL